MSHTQLALVEILAVAASFSQSVSGFGFNLLIVPPLALVIGAKQAVVTATLMGLITSALTLSNARASVSWGLGALLFVTAAAGMPVGILVLILVEPGMLSALIAVTILVAALSYWKGYRVATKSPLVDAGAGFLSGLLSTSTSMSGPPLVLYLQNRGVVADQFRGTINAFFLASGALASLLFAVGGRIGSAELMVVFVASPLILAGWAAGHHAFRRLDVARAQHVVIFVLIISASLSIAGALGNRTFS